MIRITVSIFFLVALSGLAGDPVGWTALGRGMSGLVANPETGVLFGVTSKDKGVFRSDDQGKSWTRIDGDVVRGASYFSECIDADPTCTRIVVFRKDPQDKPVVGGYSLDGGTTWQPIERIITEGKHLQSYGWSWGTMDWRSPAPKQMLARLHHSKTIWHSADAGRTWKEVSRKSICMGVVNDRILLIGDTKDHALLRSADGGASFEKVYDGQLNAAFPVIFDDRIYWLTDAGLITSTDDGATWQLVRAFRDAYWGPYVSLDQQKLVVADADGVHMSSDSGKTWTRLFANPAFETGRLKPEKTVRGKVGHRDMYRVSFAVDFTNNVIYHVGGGVFRRPLTN